MDFFLDIGPGAFLVQKCFVVGAWLLLLLVHKNFRFARIGSTRPSWSTRC